MGEWVEFQSFRVLQETMLKMLVNSKRKLGALLISGRSARFFFGTCKILKGHKVVKYVYITEMY